MTSPSTCAPLGGFAGSCAAARTPVGACGAEQNAKSSAAASRVIRDHAGIMIASRYVAGRPLVNAAGARRESAWLIDAKVAGPPGVQLSRDRDLLRAGRLPDSSRRPRAGPGGENVR